MFRKFLKKKIFFPHYFHRIYTFRFITFDNNSVFPSFNFIDLLSNEESQKTEKKSINSLLNDEEFIKKENLERLIHNLEKNNNYLNFEEKENMLQRTQYYFKLFLKQNFTTKNIDVVFKCFHVSTLISSNQKENLSFLSHFIEQLLKTSQIGIFDITKCVLLLQDVYKRHPSIKKTAEFIQILKILSEETKKILDDETKYNILFLLQILYCLVRFDFYDKNFYIKILNKINHSQTKLDSLLEIQFTSFLLSLSKLDKKYPGIFINKKEFFFIFEEKIMKRFEEDSFIISRIAPILYCYLIMGIKPLKTKDYLLEKIKENSKSFNKEDTLTLIFTIYKLGIDLDFELTYRLWQNINLNKENSDQLSDIDLINLLFSLRIITSHKIPFKKKQFLDTKHIAIYEILYSRFDKLQTKTKLVFLYEIFIKQKVSFIKDKDKFQRFLNNDLCLTEIDNYDFITVGTLGKKILNSRDFDEFIKKFKENLKERKFSLEIERNRIKIVLKELDTKPIFKDFKKGISS